MQTKKKRILKGNIMSRAVQRMPLFPSAERVWLRGQDARGGGALQTTGKAQILLLCDFLV